MLKIVTKERIAFGAMEGIYSSIVDISRSLTETYQLFILWEARKSERFSPLQ